MRKTAVVSLVCVLVLMLAFAGVVSAATVYVNEEYAFSSFNVGNAGFAEIVAGKQFTTIEVQWNVTGFVHNDTTAQNERNIQIYKDSVNDTVEVKVVRYEGNWLLNANVRIDGSTVKTFDVALAEYPGDMQIRVLYEYRKLNVYYGLNGTLNASFFNYTFASGFYFNGFNKGGAVDSWTAGVAYVKVASYSSAAESMNAMLPVVTSIIAISAVLGAMGYRGKK